MTGVTTSGTGPSRMSPQLVLAGCLHTIQHTLRAEKTGVQQHSYQIHAANAWINEHLSLYFGVNVFFYILNDTFKAIKAIKK